MMEKGFILLAVLAIIFASVHSEEDDFVVELLSPQGFRVAIKNRPHVQRVGFRGNINEQLLRHGTAQYTGDFALQSDDWWIYENPSALLNPGDTLYYRPQILSHAAGVLNFARQFHVPIDTVVTDAVVTDAVPIDAVATDAGVTDAGSIGAVVTDAGVTDAGVTDVSPTSVFENDLETTTYGYFWF